MTIKKASVPVPLFNTFIEKCCGHIDAPHGGTRMPYIKWYYICTAIKNACNLAGSRPAFLDMYVERCKDGENVWNGKKKAGLFCEVPPS